MPIFTGSYRKLGNLKKKKKTFYLCFIDIPKPLTVWIIINFGNLLERWEYQTILSVS